MVKQINGFNTPANDAARTGSRGDTRTGTASGGSRADEARSGASQDTVRLSDEAMAVQSGREAIAGLPEVNLQRVEAIKAALADGSYRIDELVIADKLLDFDRLLG